MKNIYEERLLTQQQLQDFALTLKDTEVICCGCNIPVFLDFVSQQLPGLKFPFGINSFIKLNDIEKYIAITTHSILLLSIGTQAFDYALLDIVLREDRKHTYLLNLVRNTQPMYYVYNGTREIICEETHGTYYKQVYNKGKRMPIKLET